MFDAMNLAILVAASLEAVLAQRLVRCICPDCRCEQVPAPETLARLDSGGGALAGLRYFAGAGCPNCRGTGYRGRKGLYELLRVDEGLREVSDVLERTRFALPAAARPIWVGVQSWG